MTASEEARKKAARKQSPLTSDPRGGPNPRSRKARFPGPIPPLLPSSVPVGSSPSGSPSLQKTRPVPFLPPSPPRETPRPAAHRGGAPLPLPRLSRTGKHPATRSNGNHPLPVASLPSHFRHTSDPLPTHCPAQTWPSQEPRPLPYEPAYVPAWRRDSITVRLVPPKRKPLKQLVPLYRILRSLVDLRNSKLVCSRTEICLTTTAKLPVLRTNEVSLLRFFPERKFGSQ